MTTPKSSTSASGSIKGYLDVKIPARKRKSISLFRVQVWKRHCWVVIRGDRSPAEVGSTSSSRTDQVNLSVEIYTQHEGSNHPTEGTILHVDLVHKIRRAKSKSHPYAFEVCGRRGEALLYLSGTSETESQKWMAGIRSILWPPNHLEAIQRSYPKSWEVSAISVGEVGSDWTSLGGLYGRLSVSDANIVVKDVHNGTTRVEWPLISVQRVYVATGGELEDEGKIFIVQTRPSHPCGETFLYFFSLELSELLEGLHDAVSILINKNGEDDTSVLSDLSELSGALSSVVVLPQKTQDQNNGNKMRKSTSVLDVSQIPELGTGPKTTAVPRLSCSQSNLTEDGKNNSAVPPTSTRSRLLSHFRRRSMSETNLTKICLDETDEELESREDDLEDADLRHIDVPKDRTSSSGSYNSYRSNDSGVKLSASPSTHGEGARAMAEHAARRFVTKSDSLDSGVRACVKEEIRENILSESEEQKKGDISDCNQDHSKKNKSGLDDEPDLETKVGTWCLQSAKARKSLLVKNLSTCTHRDIRKLKGLSRTMSESYKEVVDKNITDEYKRAMENPVMTKHTTVYEEIVDVLRPLNEKRNEKEHDYEELEKCRRDIKRSYSFQDKTHPPPLPPRRPKSFSPDPWADSSSKTSTLKKIFGLSFYNKSHSTDSMIEVENVDLEGRFPTSLGSDDMATVQALGTLPRIKRKSLEKNDGFLCQTSSPKMSPKQKLKSPFGMSPNRSPRIPRPRNLFIFKSGGKEEQVSPNTQAALKLHKQASQTQKTPSTDNSLQDIHTPDTPKQGPLSRSNLRGEYSQVETPEASEEPTCSRDQAGTSRDPSSFLKSPKIVTKTFNFLRKFPKDKYSSLERKIKSGTYIPLAISSDPAKVPNSFSLDSFAAEDGKERSEAHKKEGHEIRPRAMSFAPSSPAIQIPRRSCCYTLGGVSPSGTPTSSAGASSGASPRSSTTWKDEFWREGELPPPPPAPCEPQYANLDPDPDYMTVEELRSAFKKDQDDGGYLSMGDLRTLTPSNTGSLPSEKCVKTDPQYMTMHEVHNVLNEEFPVLCKKSEEFHKHRSAYPHDHRPCTSHYTYGYLQHPSHSTSHPDDSHCSPGYTSAPSSRKTSCCDASDYLTPQEVSRLLRRELISARVRELPLSHHHHPFYHHHHHHHH